MQFKILLWLSARLTSFVSLCLCSPFPQLRRNRPPPPRKEATQEGQEATERGVGTPQTRVDAHMEIEERHLYEQLKRSQRLHGGTANSPAVGGCPASGRVVRQGDSLGDCDDTDDDEGVEWSPAKSSSSSLPKCNAPGQAIPTTLQGGEGGRDYGLPRRSTEEEAEVQDFSGSIHIPQSGLHFGFGDCDSFCEEDDDEGDVEDSSGDSLDDFLLRPDLFPAQLKARRMRRFDSHAHCQGDARPSQESSPSRTGPSSSSPDRNEGRGGGKELSSLTHSLSVFSEQDAAELLNLLGTVRVDAPLHVHLGVSLLSDEEENEDDDTEEGGANSHAKVKHNNSSPAPTRYGAANGMFSPSATAWINVE